jgi:hypothetical protein
VLDSDLLVTRKQSLKILHLRASKLLKRHPIINLRGLGAAIPHTLSLACALKRCVCCCCLLRATSLRATSLMHALPCRSHGPLLQLSVTTSSHIVVDSAAVSSAAGCSIDVPRLSSLLHVRLEVRHLFVFECAICDS